MNTRIHLLAVFCFTLLGVQALMAQWTKLEMPLGPSITALTVTSDSGIFAVKNDTALFFIGSPATGRVGTFGTWSIDCFAVAGSSVYVSANGVYRLTHGATGWQSTRMSGQVGSYSPSVMAVMGTTLFAGTPEGVYRSGDNGQTWTSVSSGLPLDVITALAVNGTRIFAGTNKSGVLTSTNNGASWTVANTGLTNLAVAGFLIAPGAAGGTVLYVGTSQGVFVSTDNGATWSAGTTGLPRVNGAQLRYARFANIGSRVFAVADSTDIFLSTNNGASWVNASVTLPTANVLSIAAAGSRLYAGTAECGLQRSDDYGTTWAREKIEYYEDVTDVALGFGIDVGSGGSNTVYVGAERGVCRSTDNGLTWKLFSKGLSNVITAPPAPHGSMTVQLACAQVFAFTPATDGSGRRNIFAGTDVGGMFLSSDGGASWQSINKGLPVTLTSDIPSYSNKYSGVTALSSNGSTVWAGLQTGRVYLSTDNGLNWIATNTGMPAEDITGIAFLSATDQQQSSVLVGTYGGGIFRTTDNGLSWVSTNRGLSNLSVTGLSVVGSKVMASATSGEVYVSTDGGSSWAKTSAFGGNPLMVGSTFSIAASGTNVFVSTVNQAIWFSPDYGLNWSDVTGDLQTRSSSDLQLALTGTDLWTTRVANVVGSVQSRFIEIARRPLSGIVSPGGVIATTINQIDASAFPQVRAFVTVNDSSMHPIAGLTSANFAVTEDGAAETLLSATATGSSGSPVTLVIAVDKGEAMTSAALSRMRSYATTMIQQIREQDSAAVLPFDNEVILSTPFTSDQGLLIESIRGITGSKVSAIYDALYKSVGQLKNRTGSKAILLISAGVDEVSHHGDREVLDLLVSEKIPVYVIGFPAGSLAEEVLSRIAKVSDGGYFVEPGTEGIAGIYHDIASALRNQYRLTYSSHNTTADGSTRTVGITTSYNNKSALKQRQYNAPANLNGSSIVPSGAGVVPIGQPFWIEVKVGDPNTVKDLYGLSFKLRSSVTSCTYVAGSAAAGSFLGTGPLTFFQSPDAQAISATVTKTSTPGVDGAGIVARFQFTTPSSLTAATAITFTLSEVQGNSSTGASIAMSPASLTLSASPSASVWPGDCDNSGSVTAADVLPIGLYYGQKIAGTPVTNNPGIQWQVYKRTFWLSDSLGKKVYADANGNGVVDGADVLAVGLNYSKAIQVMGKVGASGIAGNEADGRYDGSLEISSVMRVPGNRRHVRIPIVLRTTKPVYGITFTLTTGKTERFFAADTAANILGTSLLLTRTLENQGMVDIGITSTRGSGFTGEGRLMSVELELADAAVSSVSFGIINITANDASGGVVSLSGKPYRGAVSAAEQEPSIPTEYGLGQNYPNPFNPATTVEYQVPGPGLVRLSVFDILGREVATLVNGVHTPGRYVARWDASSMSSGVYYYKMTATEQSGHMFTQTRRMTLVK